MNCPNCGAAMELVGNRGQFRCSYCESVRVPVPADDGIVATDRDHRFDCPRCVVRLKVGVIEVKKVAFCPQCRGFLTTSENFAVIVRKRRARQSAAGEPEPFDQSELRQATTCPKCAKQLETHPYGGGGNAVIDSCPRCHLVWLDPGELAVLERYRGRRM